MIEQDVDVSLRDVAKAATEVAKGTPHAPDIKDITSNTEVDRTYELQQIISSLSDIGKVQLISDLNNSIATLHDITLQLSDKTPKLSTYYDILLEVQEALEIVLLNYEKYKDRLDTVLVLVQLIITEFAQNYLQELAQIRGLSKNQIDYIKDALEQIKRIKHKYEKKLEKREENKETSF